MSTALLAPYVNTGTMSVFLRMVADDLGEDGHAVLIMDQAGWHVCKRLIVPESITVLLLPPYSPELNPIENLWHFIRSHHTSNRAYAGYDDLMDAVGSAWRSLTRQRLRSVCRAPYMTARAR